MTITRKPILNLNRNLVDPERVGSSMVLCGIALVSQELQSCPQYRMAKVYWLMTASIEEVAPAFVCSSSGTGR